MTLPAYLASLAILAFLLAFAFHIIDDIRQVGSRPELADSSLGADGNDTRPAASIYDWDTEGAA